MTLRERLVDAAAWGLAYAAVATLLLLAVAVPVLCGWAVVRAVRWLL